MFICPECGGTGKIRQTRHEVETKIVDESSYKSVPTSREVKEDIIRRKIQCLKCYRYFYTVERFETWTEQSLRDFATAGCYKYTPERFKKKNIKVKLEGIRSEEPDWNRVVAGKPIDWDAAIEKTEHYDAGNSTFSKGD